MLHDLCGIINPQCPCMREHIGCKDRYPKDFTELTIHGQNSYPIYRRNNNGRKVFIRGHQLDNRWVVPYNPYLLAKFNCHINMEICSMIQAVKYIYKGHDKIMYQLSSIERSQIIDEISNYQAARWVSPPEAMWRIFVFDLNKLFLWS